MANVIIIEDDDRVIREMTRYIREQDSDNQVRQFKSAEQFIKRYNVKNPNADLAKNEQGIGFKAYNSEELKTLDGLSYSEQAPFAGSKAKMVLSLPDMTPKKVSLDQPGPLFKLEMDKIVENTNFFKLIIPENFHKQWQSCCEKIAQSQDLEGQCHLNLPIKNEKDTWLISLKFHKGANDLVEVTLENILASEKGRGSIKRELNNREETASRELDMLSSIDLVIIKDGLIEADTRDWVSATRTHLKENKFFPEEKFTRFIVTKYEDDGVAKSTLFHQYIDDLITLPLDRLLFLQKIDIVLNLPKLKKPRFLFLQPLEKQIELSKKTRLEGFNDLSISISNPIALRSGLASTFFFNLPNQDEPIRVVTKSSGCVKHPEDPTLYVANFDYFGIDRATHLRLKGYLRNINEYKEIKSFDEEDFAFHPENIFLTDEQKRVKTVVVLDSDEQNRKQIKTSISDNMQQVSVIEDSSYYLFEKKYLLSEEEESVPLREHELYDKKVVWKVDAVSFDFVELINAPKEEDEICGNPAVDYFSGPKEWKFIFEEGYNQDLVLENLHSLGSNEEKIILVDLRHKDKTQRLAQLTIRQDVNKIEMCIMPPAPDALKGDVLDSIDAIVMDERMIPREFEDWYVEISKRREQQKLNPNGKPLKIIAFGDSKEITEEDFDFVLGKKIKNLLVKPVDSKAICYHLSKILDNSFTRYNPDNLGVYNVHWPAYVAKRVRLVAISEFGCTVESKKPLRIGTTVFLHGFIYDKAPGHNLCARLYACEEEPNKPGMFTCYFTYFGIDDQFLKYTRTWIRENYASQKNLDG